MEDCEARGVAVATVLATGFAEAGAAGQENLERLQALIARGKLRVLGASSIGLANRHNGMTLTANAAFAEPDLPKGGLFVASHSGRLIGALMSRGKRKGLGFAGLVSVGDVCMAALDDSKVAGFLLFLEQMNHADRLRDFAKAAAARGKPVAAFKLGRSDAAAELAQSHAGALAGADEVAGNRSGNAEQRPCNGHWLFGGADAGQAARRGAQCLWFYWQPRLCRVSHGL